MNKVTGVICPQERGGGDSSKDPPVSKGKKHDKFFIYVPAEVAKDATFPFSDGERVQVEIKEDALLVRKVREA
jgi:hypothetical protein